MDCRSEATYSSHISESPHSLQCLPLSVVWTRMSPAKSDLRSAHPHRPRARWPVERCTGVLTPSLAPQDPRTS
jgi:hypothetical protein